MLLKNAAPDRLPALLRRFWETHPPLLLTGLFALAAGVFFLAGVFLDPRYVTGAPVWLKPLKFAVSIGVYSFTMLWMLGFLRGRLARVLAWVVAATFAVEWFAIIVQAARGTTSHFNLATPFDAALYSLMGAAIAVLWLANLGVAVLALRARFDSPVLAWGVRLGLIVSLVGLAEGFLMTSPTAQQLAGMAVAAPTIVGAHSVGVPDGGPGLPVVGWSTRGGDLRVGHFVGMHALQVLPLLAALLLRRRDWGVRRQLGLLWIAAGLHLGLTLLVTWQALRAQPLLAPDALTLGALGALIGAAVLAALAVLRLPVRSAEAKAA